MGFEEILNMYVLKSGTYIQQNVYTTPDQFKAPSNILMNELILNNRYIETALSSATFAYSPLALEFGTTLSHLATDGKTYYWAPLTGMHTKDFKIVGDKKTRWRGLYVEDLSTTGADRILNVSTDDWLYIFKGRE